MREDNKFFLMKVFEQLCKNIKCGEMIDMVDWKTICSMRNIYNVDYHMLETFADRLEWQIICDHQDLPNTFIHHFMDHINWESISLCHEITEEFVDEFHEHLQWENVILNEYIDFDVLEKYVHYLTHDHWKYYVSKLHCLPDSFINKYSDKLYWRAISLYKRFNEDMMDRHFDKLDIDIISMKQKFSEEFLFKYGDRLNWKNLIANRQMFVNFTLFENWIYIKYVDQIRSALFYAVKCKIYKEYDLHEEYFSLFMSLSDYSLYAESHTVKMIQDKISFLDKHAYKIQHQWKECIVNPVYKVCRNRLLHDFKKINDLKRKKIES